MGRILSRQELVGYVSSSDMAAHNEAVESAGKRIAELEAALRDCIPFLAINMDKYRRDFGLNDLHPTHAEILDRVSRLTGGEILSSKLAG
jgi:hypothetical protein